MLEELMKRELLFQDADGNKVYSGDLVDWRKHYKQGEYWGDCKYREPCYCKIHKFVKAHNGYYVFSVTEPGMPIPLLARDYELRKIDVDRMQASEVSWYIKFKEEVKL
jgi:hypothetical protein